MADPADILAQACAAVRPGEPADAVGGVVPAAVASPATVGEASELLRTASGLGLGMLPRGNGTKLHWGPPPGRLDLIVDTTRLNRVIEHAAGDLVVRVQAGLPVTDLADSLAVSGQQLALDAPRAVDGTATADGPAGTVGGVIATGFAGPRRLRYGAPRDLLIGITVVLADGTVASSGGKVVKNVAGYDLGKLFAGSRGTLGLIAEAAFRLHPLPQAVGYVTATCPGAAEAAGRVRAAVESKLVPSAAEINRPAPGAALSVAVLLEGASDALPERLTRMRDILGPGAADGAAPPAWWGRGVAGPDGATLRIAFPPGKLAAVLDAIDECAQLRGGAGLRPRVRGSAGAGVLEAGLDGSVQPEDVAAFTTALRRRLCVPPSWGDVPEASVTVVHAPSRVLDAVPAWDPGPALGLMRAVKDQFDPGHLMSPGRLAAGI